MLNGENKIIKCLVVDDEPMARDVLHRYIDKVPMLTIVGEFSNAIDALVFLRSTPVALIFLDIRMPELLGTEFVKSLHNPPKIIFTTAFKEYALDGYELDVVDYLLKPIRFERFLRSINKAFPTKNNEQALEIPEANQKTGTDFIYLRVDKKLVRILLSDIFYIESARDYVKVFTTTKILLTRLLVLHKNNSSQEWVSICFTKT